MKMEILARFDGQNEGLELIADTVQDLVVLENNNKHLTRLSAEELSLSGALLSPRQDVVLGACQEVGPGEPGSAAVQAVRPSAW